MANRVIINDTIKINLWKFALFRYLYIKIVTTIIDNQRLNRPNYTYEKRRYLKIMSNGYIKDGCERQPVVYVHLYGLWRHRQGRKHTL